MTEKVYKRFIPFLLIAFSVAADRITKAMAVTELKENGVGSVDVIGDVFSFTYHENRGAAFGMFSNSRWIFMTISTLAILAIAVYLFVISEDNILRSVSLSFIVGGGIGNMIDRIFNGYVVDFLYFELIDFPVFNVADIFVTIGAFLLVIQLLFFDKKGDLQGAA